jgi:hypothetical protein
VQPHNPPQAFQCDAVFSSKCLTTRIIIIANPHLTFAVDED